jgi:hypothetical protein
MQINYINNIKVESIENASGVTTLATTSGYIALKDGITAPNTVTGYAVLYVDTSDGDLKVKFGDGTVKTISVDT